MSFLRKPNFILGLYLSVFEFAVLSRCSGNEKRCFPDQDKVVCYFLPNNTVDGLVWEEAWKICQDNDATLPVITNKALQSTLEDYLKSQNIGYNIWTSARESRNTNWTWFNGRPDFNPTVNGFLGSKFSYNYFTHGVVKLTADGSKYLAAFPLTYVQNHVCQYIGRRCDSNGSIVLKNGCLLPNDSTPLNFYDARNRCFEDGGDLAVFDDDEDQSVFAKLNSWFRKDATIWIGLRRQWWTWNKTSDVTEDVIFSNWLEVEGVSLNKGCMIIAYSSRKWKQSPCTSNERFICQIIETERVTEHPEKPDEPQALASWMWVIVGSLLGVMVLTIIVVASLVLIKKRNGNSRKTNAAPAYETVEEHKPKQPIKTKEIESYQELQEHYAEIVEGHKPTPPAQTKEVTPRNDAQEHYAEITRKAGNKGGGGGKENETVDKVYGGGGGGIVYAKIEFQKQDPEGSPDAVEYSLPKETSSDLNHPQAKTNKNRGSSIELPSGPQFPEHSIYANTGEQ